MSGTPLWKIREQMAQFRNVAEREVMSLGTTYIPEEPPNVLVDAASVGGPSGAGIKANVRHVIVKDLNKLAKRSKIDFPKSIVFKDKAPIGLYAIFDGQSAASVGPA